MVNVNVNFKKIKVSEDVKNAISTVRSVNNNDANEVLRQFGRYLNTPSYDSFDYKDEYCLINMSMTFMQLALALKFGYEVD